ncbi:hypothetical protein [Parasphingorhabdus sp.]
MTQLNKTNARQGFTTRYMPLVLGLSTILAAIALAAVAGLF